MILLYTDFGTAGPYVGEMHAVLAARAPGVPAIDLMHDAPVFGPRPAAYLLAALAEGLPAEAIVVAVVDPGVGTARRPIAVEAGGRWFVGPDNGLLAPVLRRARRAGGVAPRAVELVSEHGARLSATFHGRDLFAPAAAAIARGEGPPGRPIDAAGLDRPDWPDDLAEVIYLDGYGNAMTGLRASVLPAGACLRVGGRALPAARTFGEMPEGAAFAYENSSGLMEIAVNRGSAAAALGLATGTPVEVVGDAVS
ncbi:MAG: SAM-dependent chlorinase/fluorinase [Azospirillaceae bacterium]